MVDSQAAAERDKKAQQKRIEAWAVKLDGAVQEAARRRAGKFVLATDELDARALPTEEVLVAYKGQGVGPERGFRFLKDPLCFADLSACSAQAGSLFLKSPQRLMALVMVMGLALLVYALAEHKLRQRLQESGESIPNQVGKPTQRPTLRRIFQTCLPRRDAGRCLRVSTCWLWRVRKVSNDTS